MPQNMSPHTTPAGFDLIDLGDGLLFFTGRVPGEVTWLPTSFEAAWAMHPTDRPHIHMPGGRVQIPRWQQAYGADYRFSGQVSRALPVPELFAPLLSWARSSIHNKLNGLLLNWYEGPGHYIGPHHDSTKEMVDDAPIVTISFGETRTFRLTQAKGTEKRNRDFPAPWGTVFILPYTTNRVWKHAVPKSARYSGRRISVTIRAFETEAETTSTEFQPQV